MNQRHDSTASSGMSRFQIRRTITRRNFNRHLANDSLYQSEGQNSSLKRKWTKEIEIEE